MKWLKRTFISMIRKPAQSILMFIIVFVLGNVLFASIAVKQTSEDVRLEMRARIPSYLTIIRTNENQVKVTDYQIRKTLDDIKDDENIKRIDLCETIDFQSFYPINEFDPNYSESRPYSEEFHEFVLLRDANNSMYDYKIKEGRFYTQEELDKGEYKIVLSEWEATKYYYDEEGKFVSKKYEVGDKIKYSLYNYKIIELKINDKMTVEKVVPDMDNLIDVEFEIIGIYNQKTTKQEYMEMDPYAQYTEVPAMCAEEMLARQQAVLDKHSDSEKEKAEEYMFRTYVPTKSLKFLIITTKGMDASEQLQTKLLENENYPKSYFKMLSSVEDYRYIQAPLENLVALADVALWASIMLVIVLLGLVSILFIRNRTFEIGVLMAIGEKKLHILMQFVCEIVLVGLLATSFSMVSGNALGGMISEEFMRIQIDADYEMEYLEKNPDMVTQLDLLEVYDVTLTSGYVLSIFGISTLILIISSAAPVLYILNIKPKKVLM